MEQYARKRIYNGCSVPIKNSVTRITVQHHWASLVMPNSYSRGGIFNLYLTTIEDSWSVSPGQDKEIEKYRLFWTDREKCWPSWLFLPHNYSNDPKYLDRLVWANSIVPNQTAPSSDSSRKSSLLIFCHCICIFWIHNYSIKNHI